MIFLTKKRYILTKIFFSEFEKCGQRSRTESDFARTGGQKDLDRPRGKQVPAPGSSPGSRS
jgi:hypothetical protein